MSDEERIYPESDPERRTVRIRWQIGRLAWINAPPLTIVLPYTWLWWNFYWEVK